MSVIKPTITKRKTLEKDANLHRVLKSTMQYYDAFSDSYITFYDNWTKAENAFSDAEYKKGYDRVAQTLSDMVNPEEVIIDIGCGVGVWSQLLAQQGAHVTSIDCVMSSLRKCNERAQTSNLKSKITAVLADGFHLPFREHTFDGATLNWVLAHIPVSKNAVFLREVSRVVKENGWLFISDSYWRGQKGGKEQTQVRKTDKGDYEIYKYYYEPEELCNLVDKAFGRHCHMETTKYELICVARRKTMPESLLQ